MFPHIIEVNGIFYIRKFGLLTFWYLDPWDGLWWLSRHGGYKTREEAKEGYKNSRNKFRGFIF